MFYYLLAKNVNIIKNIEYVASITVIKYIILMSMVKIIEFKYLESGFFTPYIIALMVFDLLFSTIHHYQLSQNANTNVVWEDNVQYDFSVDKYKSEIDQCREEYGKRTTIHPTVTKPFNIGTSNINVNITDEKFDNSEIKSDTFDTDNLEGAINKTRKINV